MTDEELIDLGKVLRHIMRLQHTVKLLRNETFKLHESIRKLPCMAEDTKPDCPAVMVEDADEYRDALASMSDDEPDSVVTRAVSVHAGPFSFKGPGIMVAAIVSLVAGATVALALTHHLPRLF